MNICYLLYTRETVRDREKTEMVRENKEQLIQLYKIYNPY